MWVINIWVDYSKPKPSFYILQFSEEPLIEDIDNLNFYRFRRLNTELFPFIFMGELFPEDWEVIKEASHLVEVEKALGNGKFKTVDLI